MPRLLISAAHTLENPGEVFGDLREANITRKILKKTLPYLDSHKIEYQAVPLDLQLLKRIDWIKETGYSRELGDIFLEIHVNDGGKRGIEGWFEGAASPDNNSKAFADSIVEGICKITGYQNQGVKSEYEHELGSLIILNQSNVISTAIECLYIDNSDDIQILKDESKLDELAKAIADSVNEYIVNVAPKLKYTTKALPTFNGGRAPVPSFTSPSPFAPQASKTTGFAGNSPLPSFNNQASSFNSTAPNKPILMDREERKEMIKKVFLKVLGKEPNQNDLNYHLNTGVAEMELLKKLVEGDDHAKLVKEALEFKELNDKVNRLNAEIDQLKANNQDNKAMYNSMNQLLEHKNLLIARLHQELSKNNIIVHGGHIDSMKTQLQTQSQTMLPQVKKKRTFTDFLMDVFKL